MEAPVLKASESIINDQLTYQAQIAKFHDFTGWPGGFPHHVNL
jgi:hypothetical protein